jgi:integrase
MLAGQRRSRTFATRTEALDWLADVRTKHRRGTLPTVAAERETVASYLARWLQGRRGRVAAHTWQVLELNIALHLLPRLGAIRLAHLTADDVRTLQGALLRPPAGTGTLAPATVQKVRSVLRQALTQAVGDGLLDRNVVDTAPAPRLTLEDGAPGPQRVLPPEAIVRFWAVAGGHPLEALWRLACLVPSRSGELRALRWADLQTRQDGTGQLAIRRSKTAAGVRLVALDADVMALLRAHRARQDVARLAAGPRWASTGLLFCTAYGAPLLGGNVLRAFRRLLRRAGLPDGSRLHDLRHTAVSALLADGVPLAEVAQLAGHANPGVTARLYAHAIRRTSAPATGRLARFYRSSGAEGAAEDTTPEEPTGAD